MSKDRRAQQAEYRAANRAKTRAASAKWRAENPDKVDQGNARWRRENPEKVAAQRKAYCARARGTARGRWASKKNISKTKGIEFNLPIEFFENIPSHCPQCGKMPGPGRMNSLSVDRLDPKLGYVVNNVEWICGECNSRKRDLTYEEMLEFAQRGLQRHSKQKA